MAGESFCFETVMSDESKLKELKFAKTQGYTIYLYFICTAHPDINIGRVSLRVDSGGHNVSSIKIVSRYYNALKNLFPAIELSDKCYLFDNSQPHFENIPLLAIIRSKGMELISEEYPEWFYKYVYSPWIKRHGSFY